MAYGPLLERILPIANAPTQKGPMNRVPARESVSIGRPIVVRETSLPIAKLQEDRRSASDPRFYRTTQFGIVSCTYAGRAVPNHPRIGLPAVKDEADVQVGGGLPVKFCHMHSCGARTSHESFLDRPPSLKTIQRFGNQIPGPIECRVRHAVDRRSGTPSDGVVRVASNRPLGASGSETPGREAFDP